MPNTLCSIFIHNSRHVSSLVSMLKTITTLQHKIRHWFCKLCFQLGPKIFLTGQLNKNFKLRTPSGYSYTFYPNIADMYSSWSKYITNQVSSRLPILMYNFATLSPTQTYTNHGSRWRHRNGLRISLSSKQSSCAYAYEVGSLGSTGTDSISISAQSIPNLH
jgi:hypothetical protein